MVVSIHFRHEENEIDRVFVISVFVDTSMDKTVMEKGVSGFGALSRQHTGYLATHIQQDRAHLLQAISLRAETIHSQQKQKHKEHQCYIPRG